MIAEITAALAAIRETAQLAKLFNEAKTEAEINAAVSELNLKLSAIQRECIYLFELVGSYQEANASLKAKIAEYENFQAESEGYALHKTEAGSLVYSKQFIVDDSQITVNACPHCFHHKKLSMLQPGVNKSVKAYYWVHFCPSCNAEFKMDKVPSSEKPIHERLPR